jgi:hypothetical protein
MLDAIAEIDNLGMEDSTLAADASTNSLEPNAVTGESQGSSMQETNFNQSLMDMMASLNAQPNEANPSLQVVSGQSVEDALADTIPGLDPTTVTPPDPLAQNMSMEQMVGVLSNLNDPESLGEAFQTVSDGFEGLSNSFEQLAASFLAEDGNQDGGADTLAIGTDGDDTNADLTVTPIAAGDTVDDANVDAGKNAIADVSSDDIDISADDGAIGGKDSAMNADSGLDDFGLENMTSGNAALGMDFNLDFDALRVNVDQVSRGLQFLVQQLEAAFEGDDSPIEVS